jgi:serine protease Do
VQVRSGESGSASGVIWDDSGVIVTNAHVARSSDLTIELWDGRSAQARLDRRDVRRDLAILRVAARRLEAAHPGDSSRVHVGEIVIAVGNPLGFVGALSTGVVHALGPIAGIGGQGIGSQEFIQTTARLAPGNSGGPLADAGGNVIGINTAVVSGGLGIAIPANAVGRLLTADHPPVELGVTVRPVRIPGPDRGIALLVLDIAKGSPADYASLRVGDFLIGAAGRRFASVDDLRDCLDHADNRCVTIQFLRGGQTMKREVTVRVIQGVAA